MTSHVSSADVIKVSSAAATSADIATVPLSPYAWTWTWLAWTGFVALAATSMDAMLLQRKNDVFTGGFLSVDHLRGAGEIVTFLVASIVSDAGVAGVIIAGSLVLAHRLQLGRVARAFFCAGAGLLPFVLANVASYRILQYMGGAFDFDLLFNLTDRRPSEVLAVAAAPLWQFSLLCAIASLCLGVAIWAVQKVRPSGPWYSDAPLPRGRLAFRVFTLLLIAFGVNITGRLSSSSLDNGLRRKSSGVVFGWLAAAATDFDGDGYGLLSRVRDPAPFAANIHPYAVDIPGNGIDEDGIGGDVPNTYTPYVELVGPAPQFAQRPDVVLILLETFRADVVGATLNGLAVTPSLDRLAAGGVSSRNAWSHNGYTVQSRFHLLSGSLANLRGGTTLIDDFLANGYEVGYFSGQDESFGGGALPVGYERASVFFDARQAREGRYTLFSTPGSLAVPFTVLADRVTRFLSTRDRKRPLFLYVNFHDTHFPYTHRFIEPIVDSTALPRGEIKPGRRVDLRRTYLNTAANVDRAIGLLLEAVRTTTGREPAVVVTADHGESLFEEGFLGHGYGLNEAQTRIPLIASGLPLRIDEPWGQVDLRDALRRALMLKDGDTDGPTLHVRPTPVFQYLGDVRSTPQIAFRSVDGEQVYDLRTDRFRLAGEPWRRSADLHGDARQAFLALLHFWEAVRLAQRTGS